MYNENLIAAIKVDGKLIKESNGETRIPFGCEYSIYLKNMSSKKVLIDITIDGDDILNKSSLILDARDSIDLERFLYNHDSGRKFRFIEMTSQIEGFRGNKAEDGLINISYRFEDESPRIISKGIRSLDFDFPTFGSSATLDSSLCHVATNSVSHDNERGFTAKGSESNQKFRVGSIGRLETQTHNMVLQLFGYHSEHGIKPNSETIYTKVKICTSCGTLYDADDKTQYCSHDGTFLEEFPHGVNATELDKSIISEMLSKLKAI